MQLSLNARKAVAVGLAFSTILWASVGLVPQFASAAVHSDGCVVLSGGIVWLISGGTRRGITSADVFASHGYNFSQVVAATAEDVALPVGPNLGYADGTLVKGPTDPLVYIVDNGQKRGYISAAVFLGRGNTFNNVRQAAVNTFADLPTGANVADTTSSHSVGSWVISNGAIYRITTAGKAGIPDMATFLSYGRSLTMVVAANAADLALPTVANYPARAMCTGGGGNPPPITGAGLNVSLASDTPATTSLIADTGTNGAQALAPMMKVNFSSGSTSVDVTQITFHRVGVGNDGNINNAYLFDGNTRLAQMQSITGGTLTFVGTPLFTVSANTVRAITLKMDLNKAASAGQTYGFALNSANDINSNVGGSPSSTLVETGNFPIVGNSMTIATVTDLGKLTFGTVLPTSTSTVDPGQLAYEVARFPVTASNQNLQLNYIAFTNLGSAGATNLTNFKLFNGGVQVGPVVASQDVNRMVAFDLSGAPLTITSGTTINLSLRADIIGGSTLTYQWSIQNSSDVQVKDMQYGVSLFPGGGSTFSIVKAAGVTTINSGTNSFSKTSDSPSGTVALNATNVTLGKFVITANGEPVKVTSLNARVIIAGATGNGKTIKNLKLYANGVQVGSTQSSVIDSATQAVGSTTADANDVSFTLGTSLVVQPLTPSTVTLVGDLTGTAVNTDTVQVAFILGSGNAQGTSSLTSLNVPPSANVPGNALTISTSSLTAIANPSLAAVTVVKGALNQTVASFLVTAGAAEGMNLNNVTITDQATGGVGATPGTQGIGRAFANVKLYYNGAQVGSTQASPSVTAGTVVNFNLTPNILIPVGSSIQLDVHADVLSSASWNTGDKIGLTAATTALGVGTQSSQSPSFANGQGITLASAGTVTLSLDGSSPSNAQQLVQGSTANVVGVWQFAANNNEPLNVNQIIVNTVGSVGGDFQNLKLIVGGLQVGNTVPALSQASNGVATFGSSSTNMFTVPQNGFTKVTLVADITNTTNATGASSTVFNMQTPSSITGAAANQIIVTGTNSGGFATLANPSQTYSSQASFDYRTKLVATNVTVSGSSTGRVRQANDTIFKMNLAANSGYQVAFRAAAENTADAAGTAFTGGFADAGTWAGSVANSVLSTDSSVKVEGASSQKITDTAAGTDGIKYTFAAAKDLSGYNGVGFWIRSSLTTPTLSFTMTGASTGAYTITIANTNAWQYVLIPFSAASPTAFTGLTAVTVFNILWTSNGGVGQTLNVDDLKFYKEFIKANINATASLNLTTGGNTPSLVTLKDADSGTTFAAGYYSGSATAGNVYFIPTSEFDVSAGGNRNLSVITDTSSLLTAAGATLSANVNLGSTLSTLALPGDIVWYDGKVATSVPWVDTQPSPVQGSSLGY